jgi:3'-phosphoadenosine 5'-phosphosulfate sulfotransferase
MLQELIIQLKSSKSTKRRSAAKKLRKIGNEQSCLYLLNALKKEVQNRRAWETQYHMVMAIGQSGCPRQVDELYSLLNLIDLEPMVRVAFADSITRIEGTSNFLLKAFKQKDIDLVSGALRAMTFEQIKLPIDLADDLLNFTLEFENNLTYFWLAAAAPGCSATKLNKYLKKWSTSDDKDISKAAKASLDNKYLIWSIL